MTALDRLMPNPGMVEVDCAELAADPLRTWRTVRDIDLASSPIARALFSIRTLPDRLKGKPPARRLRLDDLISTPEAPGFQIFVDDPPNEIVAGAIGKVWKPSIPFLHVGGADAFAAFAQPGYVKVAWSIRVVADGNLQARVEFELRVQATDQESWHKFRRYFRLIGPGSRFVRRALLTQVQRELGTPQSVENTRPLPGDELLPDAVEQMTHSIAIDAPPEKVWPWLVQMGGRRAGFYSIDLLDNAGVRSAREIHDDLQDLRAGDRVPVSPANDEAFDVLAIEEPRLLVLGGLFDAGAERQLQFAARRPERFFHVTWAFVLERTHRGHTRLQVRARAAFPPVGPVHLLWIRFVHHLMETVQLRHLAARAEGRLARSTARDVAEGLEGASVMLFSLVTPFLRPGRLHWGLDAATAAKRYPGDDLVPDPRWSWTHGVEIDAPAEAVWPWIAQVGADRGGFYSYQVLENLAGCNLRNAEAVHREWELAEGDSLVLHPAAALRVVAVNRGRYLLAEAAADADAVAAGRPWVASSWLLMVEEVPDHRCRLISRYRSACSHDLASRLTHGPAILEPVGFAMDRRMLLGIRARAERQVAQHL